MMITDMVGIISLGIIILIGIINWKLDGFESGLY